MFRNKVSEIVYVFQKIVSGLYYWMFRNKVSELVKVFRLIVPETEIMKLSHTNLIIHLPNLSILQQPIMLTSKKFL